jgi:hypothetical protein
MQFLKAIKKLFTPTDWVEKYLSDSVDHYDLERRQRELDRGQIRPGYYGHTKPIRY